MLQFQLDSPPSLRDNRSALPGRREIDAVMTLLNKE
jgi:hypothetical protein